MALIEKHLINLKELEIDDLKGSTVENALVRIMTRRIVLESENPAVQRLVKQANTSRKKAVYLREKISNKEATRRTISKEVRALLLRLKEAQKLEIKDEVALLTKELADKRAESLRLQGEIKAEAKDADASYARQSALLAKAIQIFKRAEAEEAASKDVSNKEETSKEGAED